MFYYNIWINSPRFSCKYNDLWDFYYSSDDVDASIDFSHDTPENTLICTNYPDIGYCGYIIIIIILLPCG